MSNMNRSAVRVCTISDIECSRGCGTGPCKKDTVAPAAAAPTGFALVPLIPDDAMQAAGAQAVRLDTTALNRIWTANAVFRAMVAAAQPTVAADAAAPSMPPHDDDAAVERFAAEMKAKLAAARAKGRSGWQQCNPSDLSRMLREHVEKGDPRDVANFCMFLWSLEAPISKVAQPDERDGG